VIVGILKSRRRLQKEKLAAALAGQIEDPLNDKVELSQVSPKDQTSKRTKV
jgi:hypothetical protein